MARARAAHTPGRGQVPDRRPLPLPRPRGLVLVAGALVGLVLVLALWGSFRDWTWQRLALGWAPVLLWWLALILAIRYRRSWVKAYWRAWIAMGLVVAASLGILSLWELDRWSLDGATLGGQWGQIIGGHPRSLAIIKIVVLLALVPPIVSPRKAGRAYRQGARDLWAATLILLRRGRGLAAVPFGWLATHHPPLPGRMARRRLGRHLRLVPRRLSRHYLRPTKPPQRRPESDHMEVERSVGPVVVEIPPQPAEPLPRRDLGPVKVFGWHLPSVDVLEKPAPQAPTRAAPTQMAEQIVASLAEHGLEVTIKDIKVGPRVIRFGLVPGWVPRVRDGKSTRPRGQDGMPTADSVRVKVQSILAREKDMALVLKTPHIRLEAPVPGEAIVGLEVPNPFPTKVPLRSVVESVQFQTIANKGRLPVAFGEDTGGEPVVVDLLELPHLLIAGATGSGKSVCINTVITSLLLTNKPDRLRFLMIDPKRVELTPFNGIPHLIMPVIVDADEVLPALKGLLAEMFRRYKAMEEVGARNIEVHNRKVKEPMPYLVIVVDELADLMMSAAYEVEQSLVRLAQLGRATGVHVVLATQRPSVNVVTGLIKANIPARTAFAVASQVDSRVVLDTIGAEKLLGKGDMLFLSQDSPKPRRVQGALVQDDEIEKLVEEWRRQKGPPLPPILVSGSGETEDSLDEPDDDDLLQEARELAETTPHLSPSLIQRRLQVGYSKALQLLRSLEEEGITTLSGPR